MRRRFWKGTLAVALILLLGCGVGWHWLKRQARRQAISQLVSMNGAPVEVQSVTLSWSGLTIHQARLLGSGDDSQTWLKIERIQWQSPLWKMMRGDTRPQRVRLDRPTLGLQFDASGHPLNQFPSSQRFESPCDQIDIYGGRVELHQQGRGAVVADNIDLQVRGPTEQLLTTGTIGDLLGASWTIEAQLDGRNLTSSARMTTQQLRFDLQQIRDLPFVPAEVFDGFQAQGVTTVAVEVIDDPDRPFAYKVELVPQLVAVEVPAIELRTQQFTGKLTLANGILTGKELSAQFAGGRVDGDTQWDFRQRPFHGTVEASIRDVLLSRLPTAWSVSRDVDGVLNGQASLDVELSETVVTAGGTGSGSIDEATVMELPSGPIRVGLNLQHITYEFAKQGVASAGLLTLDVNMNEVAVRDVLQRLKIVEESLPITVSGQAAVQARLEVPLATLGDTNTYRGGGTVSFDELALADARLTGVKSHANFQSGAAVVESFSARLANGGRVFGGGKMELSARWPIDAEISLERVPSAFLSKLASQPIGGTAGELSGKLQLSGYGHAWQDVRQWDAAGKLQCDELVVFDQMLGAVSSQIELEEGVATLSETQLNWRGAELRGTGSVNLRHPFAFAADFTSAAVDISDLAADFIATRMPSGSQATASVRGTLDGQLAPLAWRGDGSGSLREARYGRISIPDAKFAWKVDSKRAEVTARDIAIYDGRMDLRATLPSVEGRISEANFTLRDIDANQAAGKYAKESATLAGKLSGEVRLTHFDDLERLTVTANLAGASAKLHTIDFEELRLVVNAKDDDANFRLTGRVLGGQAELAGAAPLSSFDPMKTTVKSTLRISGIPVSRVLEHYDRRPDSRWKRLDGELSGEFDVAMAAPAFAPEGTGTLAVRDLAWDRTQLARQAVANVALTASAIELRDIHAPVNEGSIRGELTVSFEDRPTGVVRLTATRLDAQRIAAPWPQLARLVAGSFDARVQGVLGDTWTGTADFLPGQTQFAGITVRSARIPVAWSHAPRGGQTRLTMRETTFQVARGRVTARANVDFGQTITLDTDARLAGLDIKALLRRSPRLASSTSGRLSGRLKLNGSNVRSLDDLKGTFDGSLTNSQTMRFPVLKNLNRFVNVGSLSATTFDSSEVSARLAKGVVHLERLAIANSTLQVLIDGKVTLRGRLDLDVTANTAQVSGQQLRRLVRSSVMLAQPVPVAVLLEANDFLSDRLIYLHVGGTIRAPLVRPRAAPLLQQEAVQFFLREANNGASR